MGKLLKILLVSFLCISIFQITLAKSKMNKEMSKESEIKQRLLEFIAGIFDLLIRFIQLIQDFFSLIIKFLNWLKESLLKI